MSYPGELAQFTTLPSGFSVLQNSYLIEDGFLFHGNNGTDVRQRRIKQ